MNEFYSDLLFYLRAFWRRRWHGIAVTWIVCIGGWGWVASLPDSFESSARVYVDTDSMLGPLMQGLAVDTNIYRQIEIMQRTLLSRPNLEKVTRMTDLDLTANTAAENERLLDELAKRVEVRSQGTNLFEVRYTATSPELAKRVVQALLTIFVETNLGVSRKDMDQARRFIEGQISQYETKLEDAEERRADFKRRNLGILAGQGGYYQRLVIIRESLAQTQGQLDEAISKRNSLRAQIGSVGQFLELVQPGARIVVGNTVVPLTELDIRARDLELALDNLLLQYTEKHPDVIAVRRRLDSARRQIDLRDEELGAGELPDGDLGAGPSRRSNISNPVYEQIKLSLVEEEANIAILQERVAQQREKVAEQRALVDTVPAVETELAKLDRDYGIIKRNYEELLARRESARIAQELDTKADKIKFRVIDPPKAPVEPTGPKRLLFLTVVLIAGLGAGLTFGLVLGQIDDTFSTVSRLKSAFVVPVLGTISAIVSAADRRRRAVEFSSYILVCLGLVGAFGGLIAIEVLFGLETT